MPRIPKEKWKTLFHFGLLDFDFFILNILLFTYSPPISWSSGSQLVLLSGHLQFIIINLLSLSLLPSSAHICKMSNSTESPLPLPNYTDPLNLTVSIILLVVRIQGPAGAPTYFQLGVFGLICNGSIVYIFRKEKSERTSFNLICVFRSFSNIYILATTFLGLFLPKTIL